MNRAVKCSECGSLAVLYTHPNEFAGMWECQNPECGASDTHEHTDYQIESRTVMYMRNGEADDYETEVYVCGMCGVDIDPSEADPAEDRAEAIADSQIMEALGK